MKRNDTTRFDMLIKRLSTGELTDAERRELDELCAANEAFGAEVRETEAILTAARSATVDQPSDFEWAAFSTRLKATIAAEPPRPYGRLRLWLAGLQAAFAPRRLAVATSAVAGMAIALVVVLIALRPGPTPTPVELAEVPELEWTLDEIEGTYVIAEADLLPGEEELALEQALWAEFDAARGVIEEAPSLNGDEMTDEEYILG